MKIKKVDDKPMVLHTKEKAKLHTHEPKSGAIKGSGVYTVSRGPKVVNAEVSRASARNGAAEYRMGKGKKTYRKSTIHQIDAKEHGLARLKRNIKESQASIKTRESNLHIAGRTGVAGAKAVTDQMEGGEEIQQAAYMAHELSRPVTGISSKGAQLFKQKSIQAAKKRIKKVDAGKNLVKAGAKKTAKESAKKVAKETAKTTAKETAKISAKVATKVGAAAAGSAVAPGVGTAIGIAAGYAAGVAVEAKDTQITNRNRKIKFFLDKMKAQENQQDSLGKLVKDLVTRRVMLWVKAIAPIVGLALLIVVLLVAMVALPVVAIIAVLYNSPFALFLPPLESGDTVQTVTSAYVSEFNREVHTLANDHTGYDTGQVVYVNYEGTESSPSNYYDIMAVYMVKYGVGDTAVVMNNTSKAWLKSVVDDMCSYTTSTGTEDVEVDDGNGGTTTTTQTVLYVNVSLKSYHDMISIYGFDSDQVQMLSQIMSPEFMGQLGWNASTGGGGLGASSISEEEIQTLISGITDPTTKKAVSYALHRVGYPYSQAYRHSGNYYDCSSLVYYAWLDAGVDISYYGGTTASYEGHGLSEDGKTVTFDQIQPGDLIFYSYENNGCFMNISHVAMYVGNGKAVEALNERVGVVYRDVSTGSIVLIGRPN